MLCYRQILHPAEQRRHAVPLFSVPRQWGARGCDVGDGGADGVGRSHLTPHLRSIQEQDSGLHPSRVRVNADGMRAGFEHVCRRHIKVWRVSDESRRAFRHPAAGGYVDSVLKVEDIARNTATHGGCAQTLGPSKCVECRWGERVR
jgi:hypothetical protein